MPLLKDRWIDWARDWGLVHRPEKGSMRRTECVLGARAGLLIRVGWGSDRNPGLVALLRFPRTANAQALGSALISDPGLDVLPGKGGGRRSMKLQAGAKNAADLAQRREFVLTDNALLWRRAFPFREPKPAEVQAWVEALIQAVARSTPVFDGRCEVCGGAVRDFVLVDGVPMLMCGSCQDRLRAEGDMADRAYDASDARHVAGATLALIAAALGAVGWTILSVLTQRIFTAAAIGVGVLVAWSYRKGAGRVDQAGRAIAAALTVSSVVIGEVLLYSLAALASQPGTGFRLEAGWSAYVQSWQKAPGENIVSLLFGLVGAWAATRALARPRLRAKIEQPEAGESSRQAA